VPVALLFFTNRGSTGAGLVEVFINLYVLFINRASVPAVWKRVYPILIGLRPGRRQLPHRLDPPGWLKFATYPFCSR